MELTPELQELIEQYLNGQLQGQALRNFEQRIRDNQRLAEEVAFQQELHLFLAETPENDLRKKLQQLGDQVVEPKEKENKGWWWWLFPVGEATNILDWLLGQPQRQLAWVLPLLLIVGWWLMPPKTTLDSADPIVEVPKSDTARSQMAPPEILVDPIEPAPFVKEEQEEILEKKANIPQTRPKEQPYVNQENLKPISTEKKEIIPLTPEKIPEPVVHKLEETPNIRQLEPTTPPSLGETMSSIPSSPIEYDRHPILHQLILDADNSFKIKPDTFTTNFVIANEAALTHFYFSGIVAQQRKMAKKGLRFHLFSNQAADYEAFTPITSLSLEGKKLSKGNYQYTIQERFELTPARYYFIIQDPKTKENYYIGYFSVVVN